MRETIVVDSHIEVFAILNNDKLMSLVIELVTEGEIKLLFVGNQ